MKTIDEVVAHILNSSPYWAPEIKAAKLAQYLNRHGEPLETALRALPKEQRDLCGIDLVAAQPKSNCEHHCKELRKAILDAAKRAGIAHDDVEEIDGPTAILLAENLGKMGAGMLAILRRKSYRNGSTDGI